MAENIIFHYINIINDYFDHMIQSELLNKLNNSTYIFSIGLNTIIHIYKICLINSKSFDVTQYLCQKAYYCYLEYIEQMNKSNLLHNLNNSDAIIFVYKKTISDSGILNCQNTDSIPINNSLLSTKISINGTINESTDELEYILNGLSIITKTILFFKTEYLFENKDSISSESNKKNIYINDIKTIMTENLNKYLSLLISLNEPLYEVSILFNYIEMITKKIEFTVSEYCIFLGELYKYLKKLKKNNELPTKEQLTNITLCCLYDEENIKKIMQLIKSNKMNMVVKQLFL